MEITDEHLIIIQLLRKDPRKRFIDISRITGIPLEKVFNIYFELKNNDIIKMYTILNSGIFRKIFNIILIFSPKKDHERILSFLKTSVNVNSISLTDTEFIVHASFLGLREYDLFIELLDMLGIEEFNEYFISEIVE